MTRRRATPARPCSGPHQISLQSSLIEQKIQPIRCLEPIVLGLRQGQVPFRYVFGPPRLTTGQCAILSRPLSASFWTLDQEVFENEHALAALQGATPTHASYLAISSQLRRGFDSNNFVLAPQLGQLNGSGRGLDIRLSLPGLGLN
jgi:hypothetical protein